MIAMFGIQDPLRDGIKEAVESHARAGVTTVMVTGDNIETAKAIAHSAGILTDEDKEMMEVNPKIGALICMEGKDFSEMTGGYVREKRGKDTAEHDYIVNGEVFDNIK